jgi:hypothetical protein
LSKATLESARCARLRALPRGLPPFFKIHMLGIPSDKIWSACWSLKIELGGTVLSDTPFKHH